MNQGHLVSWQSSDAAGILVRSLRRGGVAILPTDTLYGFSGLAHSDQVISRILQLKGIRETQGQGMVALVSAGEMLDRYVAPEQSARALEWVRSIWPAPLTAILRVKRSLPWGRGNAEERWWTAAFRVPDHSRLRELLRTLDQPLVSTSVNQHGQAPLESAEDVIRDYGDKVEVIVRDSTTARASASTLVDATRWPPRLLRPGAFKMKEGW